MLEENQLLVVQKLFSREAVIQIGSINDCQRTLTVSGQNKSLKNPKQQSETPWTSGHGSWRGTTRTSVKVRWPRAMETAQEVDVAPGSPGTGKGADFRCVISATSLGKQGWNGGALSPWSRWAPENCGRRNEKRQRTKVGPMTWKPAVLIRAPLNGKRFWRRAERSHSSIDAWQRRWEKNRRDCALSVEQVNRTQRANDIGSWGAQIGRLRLRPIDRSGIDRELSRDLRGFGICWPPRWRKNVSTT